MTNGKDSKAVVLYQPMDIWEQALQERGESRERSNDSVVQECRLAQPWSVNLRLVTLNKNLWPSGTGVVSVELRSNIHEMFVVEFDGKQPYLLVVDGEGSDQGHISCDMKHWELIDPPILNLPADNGKTLDLKIRRLIPPMVEIRQLDPWFLPKQETCRIKYALSGSTPLADKANVTIHASNYSKATVAGDWGFKYPARPDLTDEVIWSKKLNDQATAKETPYVLNSWKGECTATRGVLKKRGEAARYINVANSPYTVGFCFYKHSSDMDASIELAPFWPLFDKNKAQAKSLKFFWKLHGCTRTLKHGTLLVTDKAGKEVLRKVLDQQGIATGEFDWSQGVNEIKATDMPYRVQLQAHTDIEEPNGVALAAMHTEVRLWVHPDVGKQKKKNRYKEPQCLSFDVAPLLPAGETPQAGSNLWYSKRLAEFGYHPGPVDGDINATSFKMALKEFQRSYPKKARLQGKYQRMAITGAKSSDAQDMLGGHGMVKARTRFGEVTDNTTYAPADFDNKKASTRLNANTHDQGLILWVDDRHCYTAGTAPAGCDPNFGLGNYRGKMSQADDGKVDRDAETISRPWIPLQIRPRLLSRDDPLNRATMPDWHEAMAACLGPLRVDWDFGEVVEDLDLISKMQVKTKVTQTKRVRTRAFVKFTLEKHALKDSDGHFFPNCPVKFGGLRPNKKRDLDGYYKTLFGLGTKSLKPYKAVDDSTTKIVCAAMHDDLGQDPDKLFTDCIGFGGVYFNPSTIAGDGYRVRAAIGLSAFPGEGDHPNRAILAARYEQAPAAHTCTLRNWRRTSIRGRVLFTPDNHNWTQTVEAAALHYRACHVHLVHERNAPNSKPASKYLNMSTTAYKQMVANLCVGGYFRNWQNVDADAQARYVWPWVNRKHFGINEIPADNVAVGDYREKFLKNVLSNTWDKFNERILASLQDSFEKTTGRYRGHLLVEFNTTPSYWLGVYYCNAGPQHRNVLIENSDYGPGWATGDECKVSNCNGVLAQGYVNAYTCPECKEDYPDRHEKTDHTHPKCTGQCPGTKQPNPSEPGNFPVDITYTCDSCRAHDVLRQQYFVTPAYKCGLPCGGYDVRNRTPLNRTSSKPDIVAGFTTGLPGSAIGGMLGACFVFRGDNPHNWAHEMGHHRHLEHAAGAPGEKTSQHDTRENPDLSGKVGAKDEEKRWDRCCVMGYVEKQFFCGKCVLKNRGWKVEPLDLPIKTVEGL